MDNKDKKNDDKKDDVKKNPFEPKVDSKKDDDKKDSKKKKDDTETKKDVSTKPNEIIIDPVITEALSLSQRRKRSRTMKRFKSKIKIGRKKAERKFASPEKLKKRATRHARNEIKKKVSGGKDYNSLSAAQKIAIDKKAERRAPQIKRLSRKMLPQVRKAEKERRRGGTKSTRKEDFVMDFANENQLFEAFDLIVEDINRPDINALFESEYGTKELSKKYANDTPGQTTKMTKYAKLSGWMKPFRNAFRAVQNEKDVYEAMDNKQRRALFELSGADKESNRNKRDKMAIGYLAEFAEEHMGERL